MFDLKVFCGDSGYVASVDIDGVPFTWDDMPESFREYLRLIVFPGKARVMPLAFDKVLQSDTLDGVLIQIGGRDDSVPVHLSSDGVVYKCNTTKARAREMASFIFGPVLRVYGSANWRREADGTWRLNSMDIEDFKKLSDDAPTEVIRRLRSIPGNSWDKVADPYALLAELRSDGDPN